METKLGAQLIGRRGTAAVVLGVVAVSADLWLVWLRRYPESIEGRWALALVAVTALAWLARGDLATLGMVGPERGWRTWIRLSVTIAIIAFLCMAAAVGVWLSVGWRLPILSVSPSEAGSRFFSMCLFAPLLEETLYRTVLCVSLVAAAGPWRAVAASGTAFALLHCVYGNASPENVLGGFFLAWAFVRSGSVCVPVLLHSLGNLLIFGGQLCIWYWLVGWR
jgi:uncharacterized protein